MTTLQFSHMNNADVFKELTSEKIDFSLSGGNVVVSGQTGKRILVYRLFLAVNGSTNVTFKDGPSTDLSGPIAITNGSFVLDLDNVPWFQTSSGNDFVIETDDAIQVSGMVYYMAN